MSANSRQQSQQQAVTPGTAIKSKKPITDEEAHMRKVALYFSIGFSLFSAIAGLIVFLLTHNIEAMVLCQIPAWLFFYRILCYLFPTHESQHPILTLLRIFGKHP
jgi:hypothetical protein